MQKYLILICLGLMPSVAGAETVQDSILSQLRDQGFTRIEVSRTLLGRTRLEATSDRLEREMVFNPQTGEILRDYWQERDDNGRATPHIMDPQAGRNDDRSAAGRGSDDKGGRGGSGSRGGDDDGDRAGHDDNGGSDDGRDGGNSGSGGGDDGGGKGRGRGGDSGSDDDGQDD